MSKSRQSVDGPVIKKCVCSGKFVSYFGLLIMYRHNEHTSVILPWVYMGEGKEEKGGGGSTCRQCETNVVPYREGINTCTTLLSDRGKPGVWLPGVKVAPCVAYRWHQDKAPTNETFTLSSYAGVARC